MNPLWTIASLTIGTYVLARLINRAAARRANQEAYLKLFKTRERKTLYSRAYDEAFENWN